MTELGPAGGGPFEFEVGQRVHLGGITSTVVGRSAGAFGAVYVLETDGGRRVAFKTPRRDIVFYSGVLDRFVEETLLWMELPLHPFVLAARRVFKHDDRPFVEMEYVPPINGSGSSVAALLAETPDGRPLDVMSALMIAMRLIDALAFIESFDESFIHGDVKPENLLLKVHPESAGKPFGEVALEDLMVLLSDFGMSRAAGADFGRRLGDINYLAPEALEPFRSSALPGPGYDWAVGSKSADVYAVGCTIFELLFNAPRQMLDPDTGSLVFAFDHHLDSQQLVRIHPKLPLPLAELLAACLDPDPAQRPQTYSDLWTALVETLERMGSETTFDPYDPEPHVRARNDPFGRYLMNRHGLSEEEAREVTYRLLRSDALQSLRELDRAAELLDEVDRMVPGLACVESARARSCLLLGEGERARALLLSAIARYKADPELMQVDSSYSVACLNLAQILSNPGWREPDTALALAEEAVSLDPASARVQLAHGMALMSARRFGDAAQALAAAESTDPANDQIKVMHRCCQLLRAKISPGEADDPETSEEPGLSGEDEWIATGLMKMYAADLAAEEH
ncbi:MAG TPA: protein kinase [Solirubrobacterales bacterium]